MSNRQRRRGEIPGTVSSMCYLTCRYGVLGSPTLISYQLRNSSGKTWPFTDGSNRNIPRGTVINLAWIRCTSLCLGMWIIPSDGTSYLKQRAFQMQKERGRHNGQVKLQISPMGGNDNEAHFDPQICSPLFLFPGHKS